MRLSDTLIKLAADRVPRMPGATSPSKLVEFSDFGSNPGALGAWTHVPEKLARGAPLVVVLHGCTQTAAGYDAGTGWSKLADRAGFALLFPEQRRGNNMNLCFNWFQAPDIHRHGGEAESIAQMVGTMARRHELDRDRIFVTGLSAGGAMTAAMLATYPDLFAAGAIIGGLPYGGAEGVAAALDRMAGRGDHGAAMRRRAVERAAGDHVGRMPAVSIWHGTADSTVVVANLDHLADQWRGIHGLEKAPARVESGSNWERHRWIVDGRVLVETWRIAGMGHGVPVDPTGPDRLGAAGPYMLAAGIDSTTEIARGWGLIPVQPRAAAPARASSPNEATPRPVPRIAPPPATAATPPAAARGIQRVIEDALRSAGLMR